jgi:hypothetical protein
MMIIAMRSRPVLLLAVLAGALATGCGTPTEPDQGAEQAELAAVVFAAGRFVAVGATTRALAGALVPESDSALVMTSSDGEAWQRAPVVAAGTLLSVTHGAGRYVAVGQWFDVVGPDPDISREPVMLTSGDGLAWQAVTALPDVGLTSVAFGNGRFVATGVDDATLAQVMLTSSDGLTWAVAAESDILDQRVAFGGGRFVVFGEASLQSSALGTSIDGESWDPRSVAPAARVAEVAPVGGSLLGSGTFDCCFGEVPDLIEYFRLESADGVAWTVHPTDFRVLLFDLAEGEGIVVATSGRRLYSSTDGRDWTARAGERSFLGSVAYGGGRFVAVGRELGVSDDGVVWSFSPLR